MIVGRLHYLDRVPLPFYTIVRCFSGVCIPSYYYLRRPPTTFMIMIGSFLIFLMRAISASFNTNYYIEGGWRLNKNNKNLVNSGATIISSGAIVAHMVGCSRVGGIEP